MGESNKQPIQLSFNRFLRVAFQGSRVTSHGGLILAWVGKAAGICRTYRRALYQFADEEFARVICDPLAAAGAATEHRELVPETER